MFKICVIMAAGQGTRLAPLTATRPKAMLPVDGAPLISKTLLQLKNKIKNIVVTVGEHSEDLVIYVLENGGTKVLSTLYKGNCWWLFNSEIREIDDPVLVLPCDNITNLNLPFIYDNYQQLGSPPCMVVPISPKHEIEGDFISSNNGIVTAISRNVKQPIYCSGIQVVNPKTVNNLCKQNEDFSDVWNELISICKSSA